MNESKNDGSNERRLTPTVHLGDGKVGVVAYWSKEGQVAEFPGALGFADISDLGLSPGDLVDETDRRADFLILRFKNKASVEAVIESLETVRDNANWECKDGKD
jgi:hypothetical protein